MDIQQFCNYWITFKKEGWVSLQSMGNAQRTAGQLYIFIYLSLSLISVSHCVLSYTLYMIHIQFELATFPLSPSLL